MDEINKTARAEGWELAYVVDNGKKHAHIEIFGVGGTTNLAARQHVITRAKSYSPMHVKALQLCIQSRVPPQPTRKKK